MDQHTGPVGADGDYLWSPTEPSRVTDRTDDACFVSAPQWEKRRATEEMGTVCTLSLTRSWVKRRQYIVWFVPVVAVLAQLGSAFNLDAQERIVFSGPVGSYFGYSVEFFGNSSRYSRHAALCLSRISEITLTKSAFDILRSKGLEINIVEINLLYDNTRTFCFCLWFCWHTSIFPGATSKNYLVSDSLGTQIKVINK